MSPAPTRTVSIAPCCSTRCHRSWSRRIRIRAGPPIEVFDGFRAALAANRAQLYLDIPSGPFYSFNRTGVAPIEGLIRNWWRQGMMGSVKAGYECIKAFSETDFTEDLKSIEVPVLVIHSEDDQIVPYARFGASRRATA